MGRNVFAMTSKSWWVDVVEGSTLTLGEEKRKIQVCIEDGYPYSKFKGLI